MTSSRRICGLAVVLLVTVLLAPLGPVRAAPAQVATTGLSFLAPTATVLRGTVDLQVAAPAGTTAVRFFLDDIQLSEVTDLYARQTKTAPVWRTATDAGWFPPGEHTLRAVADGSSGSQTVTEQVVTQQAPPPNGTIPLNGGWQFAPADALPADALDGAAPPAVQPDYADGDWSTIVVPDSFGAVASKWNDDNGKLVVYRRTIEVDETTGLRSALTFDSCYWSCRYFVNGTQVGSSTGGYLPARVDATDAIHPGTNTIAAIVDNRRTTMGVFSRVHDYYWNWGGLLQEVSLEQTPSLALTEMRAEGAATGALTIRPIGVNATGRDQQVTATVSVTGPDGSPVLTARQATTTIPAGGGEGTPITLRIDNPQLWDLDHPVLYTVHLHAAGSAAWRELTEQTGFRTVSVHGSDLLLNGKPVEDLQGFDRHADYPGLGRTQPAGLADREIKVLHDKGMRIFRPAHYPTTPAELHAADKYGLLVIEEINVTGLSGAQLATPDVQNFAESQLTKEIARDASHPSIFAFSVGNENRTDQDGARSYVANVIGLGRQLDPSRLYLHVTLAGVPGPGHGLDKTLDLQDIVAQNYYAGAADGNAYPVIPAIDDLRRLSGDKPVLLSEYGVETVLGRPGYGPGTEFFQARLVDEYNRLLDHLPHFIGKMYWTSTEFWCTPTWSGGNSEPVPPFHTKALIGYFRQPKLAWKVMFSPVRIWASTLTAKPGTEETLHETVRVEDVRGHGASGTIEVTPPQGYTTTVVSQPFHVAANGVTTVDIPLRGTLPTSGDVEPGTVRAVIDADTEAAPRLLRIRPDDATRVPSASDDFASPTLDSNWQITRPDDSGWSLTDRPDSLRLTTLPGTEEGAGATAPDLFVRTSTPAIDYTAEAHLHAATTADGQQLSLFAYAGDDDFAKVGIAQVDGRRVIQVTHEQQGQVTYRDTRSLTGDSAWVRFVRRGATYTAEYSYDGMSWYTFANPPTLGGDVRIALQAEGGDSGAAIPTYVDGLTVLTSGGITPRAVTATSSPMFGSHATPVNVSLSNGADHPVQVHVTLSLPSGWSADTTTATIGAFSAVSIPVAVTPPAEPAQAIATAVVTADGADVFGTATGTLSSVPSGSDVPLALDAGCPTSPVLSTYQPLTANSTWSATTGYGWPSARPICRDRGTADPLARDFVLHLYPMSLRVAVPPGEHETYVLFGDDAYLVYNTTISADGQVVAQSGNVPPGQHTWVHFTLDGGSSGRTVDLTFSATPGQYWSFDGLVMMAH